MTKPNTDKPDNGEKLTMSDVDISAETVERIADNAEYNDWHVTAATLRALRAALDVAERRAVTAEAFVAARGTALDAALAARDAAWRAGRDAGFEAGCEHGHDVATADARGYTPEFTREERIRALQPPADLAAEAPGDAVAQERDLPTLEEASNILRARAGA